MENWKLLQRMCLKTVAPGRRCTLCVKKRSLPKKMCRKKGKKGDGDYELWVPEVYVDCGDGYRNLLLGYGGRNKRKLLEA